MGWTWSCESWLAGRCRCTAGLVQVHPILPPTLLAHHLMSMPHSQAYCPTILHSLFLWLFLCTAAARELPRKDYNSGSHTILLTALACIGCIRRCIHYTLPLRERGVSMLECMLSTNGWPCIWEWACSMLHPCRGKGGMLGGGTIPPTGVVREGPRTKPHGTTQQPHLPHADIPSAMCSVAVGPSCRHRQVGMWCRKHPNDSSRGAHVTVMLGGCPRFSVIWQGISCWGR